jgi:hypothetical protein
MNNQIGDTRELPRYTARRLRVGVGTLLSVAARAVVMAASPVSGPKPTMVAGPTQTANTVLAPTTPAPVAVRTPPPVIRTRWPSHIPTPVAVEA